VAIIFIDVEASSLSMSSHPIEIAWVWETGQGEGYLIRPEPDWTDWSQASETVHGISRAELERDGSAATLVARRLRQVLGSPGDCVVSDAPAFDQVWIDTLMRVGGQEQCVVVRDVTEVYAEVCRPVVAGMASDAAAKFALQLLETAHHAEMARARRRHRALEDATGLWWTWRWIGRHVESLE
jgi:hypothetical protein